MSAKEDGSGTVVAAPSAILSMLKLPALTLPIVNLSSSTAVEELFEASVKKAVEANVPVCW